MSISLNNVAQTEFDAVVKAESQSRGLLLENTCRMRTNVVGNTVEFRKVGSVIANQGSFQVVAPLQDPNYAKVEVTLKKWIVRTAIDDIQRFLVNFDERREDAMLIGMAMGRRKDQLKIDALNSSGTTNTIADGGTGLTFDKVKEVVEFFDDKAVAPENRHIAISAKAQRQLFGETEFVDISFTNQKVIPTGSLNGNFVMGINWHVIPSMDEGGLPKSGDIRKCFAWQSMALGVGIGRDVSTQIDELPKEDYWQVKGKFYGEAVVIDANDVVEISIDESVS